MNGIRLVFVIELIILPVIDGSERFERIRMSACEGDDVFMIDLDEFFLLELVEVPIEFFGGGFGAEGLEEGFFGEAFLGFEGVDDLITHRGYFIKDAVLFEIPWAEFLEVDFADILSVSELHIEGFFGNHGINFAFDLGEGGEMIFL